MSGFVGRRLLGSDWPRVRIVVVRVAEPPLRAVRSSAIGLVIDAYERVTVRAGTGLPHTRAAADILREVGEDETTQVIGLPHDVVEDTWPRGDADGLAAVIALTDDLIDAGRWTASRAEQLLEGI